MRRIWALALCAVFAFCASALALSGQAGTQQERYDNGISFLQLEMYDEARAEFAAIPKFQDSLQYVTYIDAILLLQSSELESAEAYLTALAGVRFQDSEALLQYVRARQFEAAGEAFCAIDQYDGLQVMDAFSRRVSLLAETARVPEVLEAVRTGNNVNVRISAVKGAQEYRLYRANGEFDEFLCIGTLSAGQTLYTDIVPAGAQAARYRASAVFSGLETVKSRPLVSTLQGADLGAGVSGFTAVSGAPAQASLAWEDAQAGNLYIVEIYPESMESSATAFSTREKTLALTELIPDTRYTARLRVAGDERNVHTARFTAASGAQADILRAFYGASIYTYNVNRAQSYADMGLDGIAAMMEFDQMEAVSGDCLYTPQYRIGPGNAGYIASVSMLSGVRDTCECTCVLRLDGCVYAQTRAFNTKTDALVSTLFVPVTDMLNQYYDARGAWRQTEAHMDMYVENVRVYTFTCKLEALKR